MNYTRRFSEVHNPLDADYADSFAIGTVQGAYVSLANYQRAILVINVGEMLQAATLDAGLQQATTVAGAGAKAIAGKTITQLTWAGGDGDELVCIELRTEEMDVTGNFDCVNYYFTVAGAAVELSAILYGIVPNYPPVGTTNWGEVIG